MTQVGGTASLEEVLRFLKSLFGSTAFAAEVAAITTQMGASQTWSVTDVNGASVSIDTKDTFGPDMTWIPTAFARIAVTDQLRSGADNPTLLLFGQPGSLAQSDDGGRYRTDQVSTPQYEFVIDGAVIYYGSDAEAVERVAMVLADACDRLVQRNPHLGGLVRLIESVGPPTPAEIPGAKSGSTYAGSLIRWHVQVLRAL